MNFENVNVNQLRQDISDCLKTINYSASENLYNETSSIYNWQGLMKGNLKTAINKLINTYYSDLKSTLNSYQSILDNIERYQTLQASNKTLQNNYDSLSKSLYKEEEYTEKKYDKKTKKYKTITKTKQVKDKNVEKQMNTIQKQITTNEESMTTLQRTIKNSI